MKNTLNEIKSLMKRMEELPGGNTGLIKESIDEVTCKWRDVVGEEAFYDVLSGLKQGNRVTFGYINAAKVEIPKGKRLNPATNRMNQFDDYETFSKNLGETDVVRNVIKLTIYNLPWQTQDDVDSKYGEWKTKRDELADKFGVEIGKARYKTDKNQFGEKGGISQYGGNNDDLTNHTYTNLNMKGIRPLSTQYYLVMNNGHIKPIDVNKLTLIPSKPSTGIVDKLKAAGASEEDVEPLLNMQYQRFEHSKVLFVSATPETGVPTLLINNKLSNSIVGETGANKEDIIKIAQDRYSQFLDPGVKYVDYNEN